MPSSNLEMADAPALEQASLPMDCAPSLLGEVFGEVGPLQMVGQEKG